METGLRGKVVIVTGAAAGIGRATARCFAAEGARVAAWDVHDSDASSIMEELRVAGGEGLFQLVNIADAPAIETALDEMLGRWGRIDVLVNNAGVVHDAQLVKWKDGEAVGTMGEAEFDAVVAVNLKGVFLATRAVVPHMIAGGGGVVLSASSVTALYGNFGQTNYAATKAGVIGMTRSWARELGRHNIRVNAVAPGFIATDMLKSIPAKLLETAAARTPLGRLGRPEDVAAAYVWLASDAAAFVHGAVLSVDGGVVLGT